MKKTEMISTTELRLSHFQLEMKMQSIYFAGTLITLIWNLWLIDNDFPPPQENTIMFSSNEKELNAWK